MMNQIVIILYTSEQQSLPGHARVVEDIGCLKRFPRVCHRKSGSVKFEVVASDRGCEHLHLGNSDKIASEKSLPGRLGKINCRKHPVGGFLQRSIRTELIARHQVPCKAQCKTEGCEQQGNPSYVAGHDL